jgi:hypothetical protein
MARGKAQRSKVHIFSPFGRLPSWTKPLRSIVKWWFVRGDGGGGMGTGFMGVSLGERAVMNTQMA